METKHTKGEWKLHKDVHHSWIYTEQTPEDGGDVICEAPTDADASLKRWEANAKLIAAAPEMLDALNKLAAYLIHDEYAHKDGLINLIENAINKATK